MRLLVETLTFGDDVIKLFARFAIYGYPFVTPHGLRVIVYPFDFGLGMCWGCIRVELGSILDFLEVGNRGQLEAILGLFWRQDWGGYGRNSDFIIEAHLGLF